MTEQELMEQHWRVVLQDCPLDRNTPLVFTRITGSMLSLGRYAGGIKYQGKQYIYIPPGDMLIRLDAFEWATQKNKKGKRNAKNQRCKTDRKGGNAVPRYRGRCRL